MTEIQEERTARVAHQCAQECGVPIMPGERYIMSSIPPGDREVGNTRWLHGALHGRSLYDCPPYANEHPPAGLITATGGGSS
jgi:hypothetical protein